MRERRQLPTFPALPETPPPPSPPYFPDLTFGLRGPSHGAPAPAAAVTESSCQGLGNWEKTPPLLFKG